MRVDKQKNSLKDNPMHSLSTIDLENVKIVIDWKYKSFFQSKKKKKRGSNNAMEKIKEY